MVEEHNFEYPGKLKIMWEQDLKTRQIVYAKFSFYDDTTEKWINNKPFGPIKK
jgi:hypothetical protein